MAGKPNFFTDNEDLQFHINHMVDWELIYNWTSQEERDALSATSWQEYRNSCVQMLELVGEICANTVAPNAAKVEKEHLQLKPNGDVELGVSMKQNMAALIENGISGIGIHPKYGGLGGPFINDLAMTEMIARACPSTYLNAVWFSSIAHVIENFGDDEVKQEIIPRIASGEWSGSMSLTEADAGSDLAGMRTYAEKQANGTYKLFGSKRFISNGSGDLTLALAKNSKSSQGLKGLSLFVVMRKKGDQPNYLVTKIEEKVGLHGSATCELQFDGSEAKLLGKEGEGFMYMLQLMNDARIAVGLQGIGTMEAAFRMASEYAAQRKTWNVPIAKHELIAQKLLDMEVEVKAFRSLCYQAGYYRSMCYLGDKVLKRPDLSAEERKDVEKKLANFNKVTRKWTPLIKWWVGEKTVEHARTNLQIHGGYGFTTEYRAEWLVRESLILSLYEGTSQIQALMCIKDTMKDIIRRPTLFIENAMGVRLRSLSEGNATNRRLYKCKQLMNKGLVSVLFKLISNNVKDSLSKAKSSDILKIVKMLSRDLVKFENISPALLHAERICEMKAYIAMGNCVARETKRFPDRRWIADRFFFKAIPRLELLEREIETPENVISSRLGHEQEKEMSQH